MQIPLFPLQTVLFPGGDLPLQVFEVRYLDMIGRCHKAGTPFGVVALASGTEVRQRSVGDNAGIAASASFARETFHTIGTLAEISTLQRLQPGLLTIRCSGTQRFRLTSSHLLGHGLWMGEAELLDFDAEVVVPPDLSPLATALQRLLQRLQASGGSDAAVPSASAQRWDDCGWLANRWAEILPLALDQRQRLMALDNPLLRLELVSDALDLLSAGTTGSAPR